jgi:translation elongation factor EF-Ts
MFTKKKYSQNEYPLYIYDTKKKKLLRHIVDKIIKKKTEKKINQILQNDLMKQIFIENNKNLI